MSDATGFLPRWRLKTDGVIAPDERLPAGQTVAVGLQHIFAMFGATVLAPILMGFDPNIGDLLLGHRHADLLPDRGRPGAELPRLELLVHRGRHRRDGLRRRAANPNIAVALGGIIAAGALYAVIGLVVMAVGYGWIEWLMPPVVTGAVVMVIGLNLAPIAVKGVAASSSTDLGRAPHRVRRSALVAVYAPGHAAPAADPARRARRLRPVLRCWPTSWASASRCRSPSQRRERPPGSACRSSPPPRSTDAITLIAPVAIVLVAENLGHVKAVAAMTGREPRPLHRPRVPRRRHRDDGRGRRRRHRRHDLRREHRRHGRDQDLLHPGLRHRGRRRDRDGPLAQVRRAHRDHPGPRPRRPGDRRCSA